MGYPRAPLGTMTDEEPDDDATELVVPLASGPVGPLRITLTSESAGLRVDRALADQAPQLSRARLQALIGAGQIQFDGRPLRSGSSPARAGLYQVLLPALAAPDPQAEPIPLDVRFEDEHLIVINKPAGMAAHPGPGVETGTLVNALLHHCAGSLSGIGGVARPGIVHRLDRGTSGLLVAAKSDAAHAGLSALFARHDIDRAYLAFVRGAPTPSRDVICTRIGRSRHDRKKMAVLKTGGREAVTRYQVSRTFGPRERPLAAELTLELETGRTHQIRVHLAARGAPCLGDPVYGSGSPARPVREAMDACGLVRQALHAFRLGFQHPITRAQLLFEADPPADIARLREALAAL